MRHHCPARVFTGTVRVAREAPPVPPAGKGPRGPLQSWDFCRTTRRVGSLRPKAGRVAGARLQDLMMRLTFGPVDEADGIGRASRHNRGLGPTSLGTFQPFRVSAPCWLCPARGGGIGVARHGDFGLR